MALSANIYAFDQLKKYMALSWLVISSLVSKDFNRECVYGKPVVPVLI